ncbi:MAG: Type 1 glutamine amidotransferase-like domain-containing protein [Candidatus Dojkabacteria bacterium]|nr:MAG: Type 1 glutamine amidotransferase-like domain-containing protein [Candidatus Dojkabacteria bacterium]
MHLYLSSYRFGDNPEQFSNMYGTNRRVALISNALDSFSDITRRKLSEEEQLSSLTDLGLFPESIDLRNYFGKQNELDKKMQEFGGVWVRGGNAFVLRLAYKLSGFDLIMQEMHHTRKDFVYGGFSAGVCVLAPSLKGLELVDYPEETQVAYQQPALYEGLGIIDFAFAPHYRSAHQESEMIEQVVEYYKKQEITYRALRDGEVIILRERT